ncbi:MAG: hypothetical protein AB7U97_25035, partial [Pirellulales bacterium]
MGPTRRFPLDEPAAGPLRARRESEPAQAAAAPASRWPVLARIAELSRPSELPAAESSPPRTTYRVDAPHESAAGPAKHAPPAPAKTPAVAPRPQFESPNPNIPAVENVSLAGGRQDRVLRAAPLPIRVALEAWQWIEPYHKLIRLAAMVTLMSAGGMAMVMMTGERPHPIAGPDAKEPVSAAVDKPAVPELEIQHAELSPALVPADGPSAETESIEPTAAGPLPPQSKPLMAVETSEPRPTKTAEMPYPTTQRPESIESILADGALPQAQFDEP